MACVENMSIVNGDSEMEEGEIVDDVDDLSDISSEEEFLLRQRLQVLENYNNVLERKKAKSSSIGSGKKQRKDIVPCNLSEISASDLEDTCINYKNFKIQRHVKPHHRQKRKKALDITNHLSRNKDLNKKKRTKGKKQQSVKIIKESSEESEDEYRNKRRKLADAVVVNKDKCDKSSLTARLKKMLCKPEVHDPLKPINEPTYKHTEPDNITTIEILSPISSPNVEVPKLGTNIQEHIVTEEVNKDTTNALELIDLSTDGDVEIIENKTEENTEKYDENHKEQSDKDSDEDLELLRQHALKTKVVKKKATGDVVNEPENKISEDEDSDTAELRLICLKSALLKKAIEMKRKQKLHKRHSQSSNLQGDHLVSKDMILSKIDSDNNTDIESVDMDIGSDGDEKLKDYTEVRVKTKNDLEQNHSTEGKGTNSKDMPNTNVPKEDELEDDEDLLRAKLLTSLTKNLPNLVNNEVIKAIEEVKNVEIPAQQVKDANKNLPEEKRFIIKLDESDSEGESEATKNLTKMHMKLSEQIDFQQQLDMFLKSTREEVENTTLPDLVKQPIIAKKPEKFVAKAVNHLPKSEQIEYKNLVKRMAELEKLKQSRHSLMDLANQQFQVKDTLKPRNITVDATKLVKINNLEKQIAMSRKKIAEESAKMLKLKEEATKLSQKYKIVATELRNISTAIMFNKKQQRSVQNCLSKSRLDHQKLLKSSTSSIHSKVNGHMPPSNQLNNKVISIDRLQKENNPLKEEYKNRVIQKTVKVSVVNDLKDEIKGTNGTVSVQVDVNSNKKIVTIPKSPVKDRTVNIIADNVPIVVKTNISESCLNSKVEDKGDVIHPFVEKGGGYVDYMKEVVSGQGNRLFKDVDDYISPLQALDSTTWEADPNAILCPYEVDGVCKDAECKYLHTHTATDQ